MTVLLYLLSDTAALFLQLNQLVGDHSTCAYNNYTCTCASRVIRALRFDWVKHTSATYYIFMRLPKPANSAELAVAGRLNLRRVRWERGRAIR